MDTAETVTREDIPALMQALGTEAKRAARVLARASTEQKNRALPARNRRGLDSISRRRRSCHRDLVLTVQ